MTAADLKRMWLEAIRATHEAAIARATAARVQAAYDEALHRAHMELDVPPGRCIDVLGDGTVKPLENCAQDIER